MAPTDNQDVTLGELSRSLISLEQRINLQFVSVQSRFDGLSFVSRDVYDVQMSQLTERITELEEARRWMFRTLVAAFVVPLVAFIVTLAVR